MRRILTAVAMSAAAFVTGCTNEEFDATPSDVMFAVQACKAPEAAPTPELGALAKETIGYSTIASDIVSRTIESCTNAATQLGVDLGDTAELTSSEEWYANAAIEIRRRCSAIEAPLLAALPATITVDVSGCESPAPCADPLSASERCKSGHVFVNVVSTGLASAGIDRSAHANLLYYLPRFIRTANAPNPPAAQSYVPSPRATLCDQTLRQAATDAIARWAPALAAAAEALDHIARASRVQRTCTDHR